MNEQRIFGDITPEEREKLLESHCVGKERTTFTQSLSDDELQISSADYVRGSMDVARLKDELKELQDQKKTAIKEKEEKLEALLEIIGNGRRQVVGILYRIPNHAEGKMYLYNKEGELIEVRPLKPDERQARAFIEGPGGIQANPDEMNTTGGVTDIDHEMIDDKPVEQQIDDLAGPKISEGGTSGFDYQQRSEETKYSSGKGSGEENGKPWDDPSQTRVIPDGSAAEQGLQEKKKAVRKKKVPQTPENPSGETNQ